MPSLSRMEQEKLIVLYDGSCGFCNFWVEWILRRDHRDRFVFASLQGETATAFLTERGLSTQQLSTLYLWKKGAYYYSKSQAALRIAKELPGPWPLLGALGILPVGLLDYLYDRVAENRNRLLKDHCFVPTAKEREKFLP